MTDLFYTEAETKPLRDMTDAEVQADLVDHGLVSYRSAKVEGQITFRLLDLDDESTFKNYTVTIPQIRDAVDHAKSWTCCREDIEEGGISYGCADDWNAIKQFAAFGEMVYS